MSLQKRKQKLIAIVLLILSILIPILTGDATADLFLLPIALFLLFAREVIL